MDATLIFAFAIVLVPAALVLATLSVLGAIVAGLADGTANGVGLRRPS